MAATISTIASATLLGVDGWPVTVEVHVSGGLPGFTVVGQPDSACREARDRVRAAVQSSGLTWHPRRYTVNLAPTGLRKVGAALDLAIAIGVLVATEQLAAGRRRDVGFLGELGLDGSIRPVAGALSARRRARHRRRSSCLGALRGRGPAGRPPRRSRRSSHLRRAGRVSARRGAVARRAAGRRRRARRRDRCRPGRRARPAARPAGARGRGGRWPPPAHGRPAGRGQDDARPPAAGPAARPRRDQALETTRIHSAAAVRLAARRSRPPATVPRAAPRRRRSRSSAAARRDCSPARSRSRTRVSCSSTSWPSSPVGARRAAPAARGGCGAAVAGRRQGRASRPGSCSSAR